MLKVSLFAAAAPQGRRRANRVRGKVGRCREVQSFLGVFSLDVKASEGSELKAAVCGSAAVSHLFKVNGETFARPRHDRHWPGWESKAEQSREQLSFRFQKGSASDLRLVSAKRQELQRIQLQAKAQSGCCEVRGV